MTLQSRSNILSVCAALALIAGVAPVHAQYDRDGRYVPSPMGKPADPARTYVPGYTGKPGGTNRLAPLPQLREAQPLRYPKYDARQTPPANYTEPLPVPYPTAEQCKAGWSRDLAIPRSRYTRACRAMGVKIGPQS
ncbi:MAG: hypothetical protein IKE66_02010 [Hyphomicrobium sp.]|nr:hypothetical protein [Hyphomicrobium sp.]